MSDLTDRTIAQLRAQHELVASRVADLSDEELAATSGAAEWSVATVLSHLGSGAEITRETLNAALEGNAPAGEEFMRGVWGRWDALDPRDQAGGYIESDEQLVAAFEALDAGQRESVRVDIGWLPQPLSTGGVAGLRLSEAAAHGWDVLVGLDPTAEIGAEASVTVLEHYASDLATLAGFLGKTESLTEPVVLYLAGTGYLATLDDGVTIVREGEATATLDGPPGAALRLLTGRLRPEHSEGVDVHGNVTLEQLRDVFRGY